MCGICGIVKLNNTSPENENITKMMKAIKHRGPDDEGVFSENNISLGFVRLSIIDLSPLGHQPMFNNGFANKVSGSEHHNSEGRYVIVYNGEVYNYVELRRELAAIGYKFKSNTDTEVVLNAYIEWGEKCLTRFNGMWAFAIYDRYKKVLFFARDRFGVKPFYYYQDADQFIFASDIPAILSILKNKITPNKKAIFDYLVFNRTDQTENTFFTNIKKLQHGHQLSISNSKIEIRKWYALSDVVQNATPFCNKDEFREVFSSAIGLRLRSDVPVGVCLSGGLDSSSIVSVLLKDFKFNNLNTFSAVYGNDFCGDESKYIDEFKSQISNMHYTNPNGETFFTDIDNFIAAHSEPTPSTSPYAQFKVMELAKNNVVVLLDGQGADESLAGYPYFFGFYFKDLLKRLKLLLLINESAKYLKNQKSLYGFKTFIYFLLPEFLKIRTLVSEKGYLNTEFINSYSVNNSISGELYNSDSLNESLLNHFEYKLEHLLKWEDRNSMWFSLESRVPFLDYRLVEKTLASPPDIKIKDGMTKYFLRESMKNTLPENIRMRHDKVGFITPEDEWFRSEKFKKLIEDLLNSESFKNRGIIDTDKAKILHKKHHTKQIQISQELWKWVNLELWYRKYID